MEDVLIEVDWDVEEVEVLWDVLLEVDDVEVDCEVLVDCDVELVLVD